MKSNPAPAASSQIGTIVIGAGAGLALCAILFSVIINVGVLRSSTIPPAGTS